MYFRLRSVLANTINTYIWLKSCCVGGNLWPKSVLIDFAIPILNLVHFCISDIFKTVSLTTKKNLNFWVFVVLGLFCSQKLELDACIKSFKSFCRTLEEE